MPVNFLFTLRVNYLARYEPPHPYLQCLSSISDACMGWSGGAVVLGKLPVPGRPTVEFGLQ